MEAPFTAGQVIRVWFSSRLRGLYPFTVRILSAERAEWLGQPGWSFTVGETGRSDSLLMNSGGPGCVWLLDKPVTFGTQSMELVG